MDDPDFTARAGAETSLDLLDRISIVYITVPVVIFLLGWFRVWVALPLLFGMGASATRLLLPLPGSACRAISPSQLLAALGLGCIWVYFSGIDHFVFANADWYTRDAVLHDLVTADWPVAYRLPGTVDLLLRAPLGFYMPAAVVGKLLGLPAAHFALAVWAAAGAILFLLQAMSLVPARLGPALVVGIVVIFFSGEDFIAGALNVGPRYFTFYDITAHLEWWAGSYQYSAMTTQMFWVPNHALAAWVMMGLMARSRGAGELDRFLPMLAVSSAVWSPLSALGMLPFLAVRMIAKDWREKIAFYLRPTALVTALLLAAVVGFYFAMDTGRIDKGLNVGAQDGDSIEPLLNQFQFFMFEAGFLGMAVLAIRRSSEVITALAVLLLLPFAQLGPSNDLVMRASIPSLVVLMLACCSALFEPGSDSRLARRKWVLGVLLGFGSITAVHEFARAVLLKAWPINSHSSLIAVSCSAPPHYVAHILGQPILTLMRPPQSFPAQFEGRQTCLNPAWELVTLREQKRSIRNIQ